MLHGNAICTSKIESMRDGKGEENSDFILRIHDSKQDPTITNIGYYRIDRINDFEMIWNSKMMMVQISLSSIG